MQYDYQKWKQEQRKSRWYFIIGLLLIFFTHYAHSAPKTLLVLGDSLSAEYGLMRGSGWVSLLEQQLQQEKRSITINNASISGETTSGGRTRLPALLKRLQPAIVIIELGSNDALRGLQLTATRANLQAMITMSKQSGAKVLLVGMQIPPNYGTDYTNKFARLFPEAAQQAGVALVPFFMKDIADKPELFQSDRIHPNEQAQATLLRNVWPYLRPLH